MRSNIHGTVSSSKYLQNWNMVKSELQGPLSMITGPSGQTVNRQLSYFSHRLFLYDGSEIAFLCSWNDKVEWLHLFSRGGAPLVLL